MVGAGQLARMTSAAAVGLGIRFGVLAASADESAAQVCAGTVLGDYHRAADLLAFAGGCDVVTFDHEHVHGDLVAAVEQTGTAVRPGSHALRYTQDKLAMRQAMTSLGIGCPRFAVVADPQEALRQIHRVETHRRPRVRRNRQQVAAPSDCQDACHHL